ncbi:hypothetical protein AMAG_18850 [Allomyces macrogynus ATCC 38327]|uniref:Uncharacterized protein n=1 Tax=Allomyces macrogynus (strain ATCC 38327) TaxID=578462 RepID=A0A0L0SIQ4_ALLM3|nr:hypothetical protein AMAG_18850 [Allomyces macrogynus ATCC 38327]|eukprot:KNE62329.1 hypothetical protein AMAG_18850 [Allomyces macrogynus ATCC 38327]
MGKNTHVTTAHDDGRHGRARRTAARLEQLPEFILERICELLLHNTAHLNQYTAHLPRATIVHLARASPFLYAPALRALMQYPTVPVVLVPNSEKEGTFWIQEPGRLRGVLNHPPELMASIRRKPELTPAHGRYLGAVGVVVTRAQDIVDFFDRVNRDVIEEYTLLTSWEGSISPLRAAEDDGQAKDASDDRTWYLITQYTSHGRMRFATADRRVDLVRIPLHLIKSATFPVGWVARLPPHLHRLALATGFKVAAPTEQGQPISLITPLQLPTTLRELKLFISVDVTMAHVLAEHMPPRLAALTVNPDLLDPEPAEILAHAFPPSLRHLALRSPDLYHICQSRILPVLLPHLPTGFNSLVVADSLFRHDDVVPLATMLAQHVATLTTLELSVWDPAFEWEDDALDPVLAHLPRGLRELSLEVRDLDGVRVVAPLAHNMPPRLERLRVTAAHIDDDDLVLLAAAVPRTVCALSLEHRIWGDDWTDSSVTGDYDAADETVLRVVVPQITWTCRVVLPGGKMITLVDGREWTRLPRKSSRSLDRRGASRDGSRPHHAGARGWALVKSWFWWMRWRSADSVPIQ